MPGRVFASLDSVGPNPPRAEDVRAALAAILSSPSFEASPRRRNFLSFIVEQTLSGNAHTLKGFTVAVGVFGRDESFDAQADPVVRLEAGRLRRDLDSYYVEAGRHDPVRISIPKGSYVPRFDRNSPDSGQGIAVAQASDVVPSGAVRPPKWGRVAAVIVLGTFLLVVLGVAGFHWTITPTSDPSASGRGPAVMVFPFTASGAGAVAQGLADGVGEDLIGDLMRFPSFRVYVPPIQTLSDRPSAPPSPEFEADYVIRGSVRGDVSLVRIAVRLSKAATGEVVWSGSYDRQLEPGALIAAQRELAGEIATVLGQPYGAINADLLQQRVPAVSSMQSYLCVQRAYKYRRSFSRSEAAPILQCLDEAVRRDPSYSEAWAMLGWLYLDRGRYGDIDDASRLREYDLAFDAASRAVKIEPDNPVALKALSSIEHYMGRYEDSQRLARQAVEINPNDPDTLAQLGWRLAVRGAFDEGIPILTQAIQRTPNPPGWYFHLIAVDHYLREEYPQMLAAAQRSAVDGSAVSQMLIAIANAELGNRPATQAALADMEKTTILARDPAAYLRRAGATDQIIDALLKGLEKARSVAEAP